MTSVHIVNSLECGGLEQMALQLIISLKNCGVKSHVICLTKKGELAEKAKAEGINVLCLEKTEGFHLGVVFKLARFFKDLNADIVHTHNFAPLIYGSLAAMISGKKCLNTRHGRTDQKAFSFIWGLNKFIVSVSEDTRKHLIKRNKISDKALKVIHNGVDLDRFQLSVSEEEIKKTRENISVKADSFVITSVGRLSPEKDHMTLLKAFKKLRKKNMEGDLVIVGDGSLRKKLEETAKEYGIEERVKFLGFRDDIVRILQASDVFILSSYREGLSLSILEAMACGKPVVATKVGGTPEMVIDGETGFLVDCGFPERIEVAVMKMYINRNICKEVGGNARKMVEEKFSLEKMTEEYKKLYQSILS